MEYLARLERSRWRKGLAALTAACFVGLTLGYYFLYGVILNGLQSHGVYPAMETLSLLLLPLVVWQALGVVGGLLLWTKKPWLGGGLLLGVAIIVIIVGVEACAVLQNVH
jgi:hypothetical protein